MILADIIFFIPRAFVSISSFKREETHECLVNFSEGFSLFILFGITGTLPEPRFGKTKIKMHQPNLFDSNIGCVEVRIEKVEGLAKFSGVGSVHCVIELDNSRLTTQAVARSSNPSWEKSFTFIVQVDKFFMNFSLTLRYCRTYILVSTFLFMTKKETAADQFFLVNCRFLCCPYLKVQNGLH